VVVAGLLDQLGAVIVDGSVRQTCRIKKFAKVQGRCMRAAKKRIEVRRRVEQQIIETTHGERYAAGEKIEIVISPNCPRLSADANNFSELNKGLTFARGGSLHA
jgi:hypothetical protein